MHANRLAFFKELMFLLLGGSGVGYSVQEHHVEQLPPMVRHPFANERRYIVQDSVIGWSDAVDALIKAYFYPGAAFPIFDFSEVRPAGTVLKTSGGLAPGPEPLRRALERINDVLAEAWSEDAYLRPIHVHDIACHLADAVLSGGIRRSAMIALFSPDDTEMLHAKSGDWYVDNLQRSRANNSAVLLRGEDDTKFYEVFQALQESGSGEPGFFWTADRNLGTNPCAEISLNDRQFCNLTTINAGNVESNADLIDRARAAAIIGTIQATFTDFHYLDPGWKTQTEEERLVGVSMTGIASGGALSLDLLAAAAHAKQANAEMAAILGINAAARVTTVKPEGTASLVLGTSSGVHPWHDPYYIRRIRFNRNEAIARYLLSVLPYRPSHDPKNPYPLEDEVGNDENIVLAVPQRAPEGAITRSEGALALLERVKEVTKRWIWPGHRSGENTNNVSTTVNVKPYEWDEVRDWLWENRSYYTGIAVLPHDGGSYTQAVYETCTREQYEALLEMFEDIDVTQIDETADYTNLAGEAACAGGACEVTFA
jgi:ribonucleoside-diphosphate reductase alpha chain